MRPGSEHEVRIFISSPVYNLVDLRNELAAHLRTLGYKPILSSENGFPQKSMDLEPWESCLPVLETCHLVVLIVDGRYGQELNWRHYPDYERCSPTHAEYLHARKHRKRILVFFRDELKTYYQMYRRRRAAGGKKRSRPELSESQLEALLPEHIDYRSLEFFGEVKKTRPIPWICEFRDVTDVKNEVHKQLLNELAVAFHAREQALSLLVRDGYEAIAHALDKLEEGPRKQFLETLGGADLAALFAHKNQEKEELARSRDSLRTRLDELKSEKVAQKKNQERQRRELEVALAEKEKKIAQLEEQRSMAILGTSIGDSDVLNLPGFTGSSILQSDIDSLMSSWSSIGTLCTECGSLSGGDPARCSQCHQAICANCVNRLEPDSGFRIAGMKPSLTCTSCKTPGSGTSFP